MAYQNDVDFVREHVPELDRIDQLEEECLELIIACKKRKRAMNGTNPTPVTAEEAWKEIKEESQDVINALCALGLVSFEKPESSATERMKYKMARWVHRVKMKWKELEKGEKV